VNILRINLNTSKSLGNGYHHQLKLIYKDMLNVYKLYSTMITNEIKQNGPNATQHASVRGMRAVKKEILLLIENFIQNCDDSQYLVRNYIPPLFEAILGDYYGSLPDAKNPMVLSVVGAAINKLKGALSDDVAKILESVVDCTLPMITKNFHDFPEHRLHYFKLLHAIIIHCFPGLFAIPPQGFRLVVNSMLWAVKHTEHSISETGLYMVKETMLNMEKTKPDTINLFYKTYYIQIFNDIFFILTDRFHFASFSIQCQILFHLIHVLTKLGFQFDGNKNNVTYMQEYLANLITTAFNHLNSQVVIKFVSGLFVNNEVEFENHLRDFLVEVKVYSKELTEKHSNDLQRLEKQKQVPGLIKE
jgi:exportin-1